MNELIRDESDIFIGMFFGYSFTDVSHLLITKWKHLLRSRNISKPFNVEFADEFM